MLIAALSSIPAVSPPCLAVPVLVRRALEFLAKDEGGFSHKTGEFPAGRGTCE